MANSQRRMVYSKIWSSEQFGNLSDKAKLIFIGSITLADDDGRLRANPAYLRGQIFPYDETITVTEVLQFRNEIEKSALITVYSVDNCDYIQHPKWTEYQIIRKDLYKESSLPKRNETVTKQLRKRTLSKDKLSKDKLREKTPAQEAKEFFNGDVDTILSEFIGKTGIDNNILRGEFQKFILYWTEKNKSGTKQRWEQQATFEVKRRLVTWLGKMKDFKNNKNQPNYVL